MSNLVVFPVNFIIITLFRKARPRKLRPSRVDEAIKTAHDGPGTEASVNDVKPEVCKDVIFCCDVDILCCDVGLYSCR